ncbi:aminopeptidase P family N-terminal domain-containing protein, partial [Rhizobium leguminosarum]|uniref:aminopeptidase P family N-terminal domain-containing protein n=1 Tax=Rhizobium leguminosarum TaxID=384 RepID=UPI003F964C5C
DEFNGEYFPACSERLAWLTGFTGSAGISLILRTQAIVFVDGRYVTQLAEQVDGSVFSGGPKPVERIVRQEDQSAADLRQRPFQT